MGRGISFCRLSSTAAAIKISRDTREGYAELISIKFFSVGFWSCGGRDVREEERWWSQLTDC